MNSKDTNLSIWKSLLPLWVHSIRCGLGRNVLISTSHAHWNCRLGLKLLELEHSKVFILDASQAIMAHTQFEAESPFCCCWIQTNPGGIRLYSAKSSLIQVLCLVNTSRPLLSCCLSRPVSAHRGSPGARTRTRCRGPAAGNIDQQHDYFCAVINILSIKNQNRVAYGIWYWIITTRWIYCCKF